MTRTKIHFDDDNDAPAPGESTPLLATTSTTASGGGGNTGGTGGTDVEDRRELMHSFRRKSYAKLITRQPTQRRISSIAIGDVEGGETGGIGTIAELKFGDEDDIPMAHPVEGLAPLFPYGGIVEFDGRGYVPYREASLVKSTPAFAPYRRMARHRSFYLWWTNVRNFIVDFKN